MAPGVRETTAASRRDGLDRHRGISGDDDVRRKCTAHDRPESHDRILSDGRARQDARARGDPHILVEGDGGDVYGGVRIVPIGARAVKISIEDRRIREDAPRPNVNTARASESRAVEIRTVTDLDARVERVSPGRHRHPYPHVVAEPHDPWAADDEPARHSEIAAGGKTNAARRVRDLVPPAAQHCPTD